MQIEKSGVYLIYCLASGKSYIGSSRRIYRRWHEHRNTLRRGKSTCRGLQSAWAKYGEDSFTFSIIEECPVDQLEEREQHHVDERKPAYNMLTDVRRRYGPEMLAKRAAVLRARAASIMHCPRGHAYDEANTYRNKKGKRICRACNAERVSQVYASETPEQREARRLRANQYHQRTRNERLTHQRAYTAAHREEKRQYDRTHRERANQLRQARQHQTSLSV